MSTKTDYTFSVTEILALIYMAVQAATAAMEIEEELQRAEAEADEARKREAERKREAAAKKIDAEESKRFAKGRLQGPLGDKVAADIDRMDGKVAPYRGHKRDRSEYLWRLKTHRHTCERVARGYRPETDHEYQKAKAWVERNVAGIQPNLEALAGTTSHRHVKNAKNHDTGMEF